jgi:hypothetical protein
LIWVCLKTGCPWIHWLNQLITPFPLIRAILWYTWFCTPISESHYIWGQIGAGKCLACSSVSCIWTQRRTCEGAPYKTLVWKSISLATMVAVVDQKSIGLIFIYLRTKIKYKQNLKCKYISSRYYIGSDRDPES